MRQEGDTLTAAEGKLLQCVFNGMGYGREACLGRVYYDAEGAKIDGGRLLTPDDFVEVEDPDMAALAAWARESLGDSPSYAQVKACVVKMRYSNDDQIALILNYAENPEAYLSAMQEMQNWRDMAAAVARLVCGKTPPG